MRAEKRLLFGKYKSNLKSILIDMTIWQRIRVTRFKYDLQDYVSHLVYHHVSARTEYENGIIIIYLIEPELDLMLMLSYTLDQIKLARKNKPYRNEILSGIRYEIALGHPEIKFYDNTGT